jgi:hypothetical protein
VIPLANLELPSNGGTPMSDTRRNLSNLLAVVAGVLLAIAVFGVLLLSIGDHLRPLRCTSF